MLRGVRAENSLAAFWPVFALFGSLFCVFSIFFLRSGCMAGLHMTVGTASGRGFQFDVNSRLASISILISFRFSLSFSFCLLQDVLHKICNPHGQVLRIVIFKKNGVQAMVEFDSLDAATRARENLNGADIYAGCCTLKIDFAKVSYPNDPIIFIYIDMLYQNVSTFIAGEIECL